MASQCTTQPPPSITICSQNCNKCVAGNTSRMLYNTLVKKLDDRDREQKIPVLTGLLNEPLPVGRLLTPVHTGRLLDEQPKTKLNPIPEPKRRKLVEPPPTASFTEKKYYCYSKMQISNRKCCSECRVVIKENDDGWSLY